LIHDSRKRVGRMENLFQLRVAVDWTWILIAEKGTSKDETIAIRFDNNIVITNVFGKHTDN